LLFIIAGTSNEDGFKESRNPRFIFYIVAAFSIEPQSKLWTAWIEGIRFINLNPPVTQEANNIVGRQGEHVHVTIKYVYSFTLKFGQDRPPDLDSRNFSVVPNVGEDIPSKTLIPNSQAGHLTRGVEYFLWVTPESHDVTSFIDRHADEQGRNTLWRLKPNDHYAPPEGNLP
jgi:hypothetical protein